MTTRKEELTARVDALWAEQRDALVDVPDRYHALVRALFDLAYSHGRVDGSESMVRLSDNA